MAHVKENLIDMALIQESWIRKCDNAILKEIKEYKYDVFTCRKSRKIDWGGGVATLFRNTLNIKQIKTETYKSFESTVCKVFSSSVTVLIINVYRLEYSMKNKFTVKYFLEEFSTFLELIGSYLFPVIITGDFNFHVEFLCVPDDELSPSKLIKKKDAISFHETCQLYNFTQVISGPTQDLGGTLDLLLASPCALDLLLNYSVGLKNEICTSDHFAVNFSLQLKPKLVDSKHTYVSHNWRNLDIDKVSSEIDSSGLYLKMFNSNVNDAVGYYNQIFSSMFQKYCPPKLSSVKSRPHQKWFSDELRDLKRTRRQAERLYKKYPTPDHLLQLESIQSFYKSSLRATRSKFFETDIFNLKDDLNAMYKRVNYLLGDDDYSCLPSTNSYKDLADEMGKFYHDKVKRIRSSIEAQLSDQTILPSIECPPLTSFTSFNAVTADVLFDIISGMNNKESSTDPIPLPFVKQHLHTFLPLILDIVNASLITGVFPDQLKHANVSPIIKDKSMDSEVYANFRPVSSLPFLSKVIEKVVHIQFTSYLNQNNLVPSHQSAYLSGHSCETALCKVASDIQGMLSKRKAVILVQLDLSAAFDTIDHATLIQLLESKFGVTGIALQFFKSYLSGRTFSVKIRYIKGAKMLLVYGVPQGSILGPLLFIIYIGDLPNIVSRHDVSSHYYADDAQLYLEFDPHVDFTPSMEKMKVCLSDVDTWMLSKYLKLNVGKTEVLFITRPQDSVVYSNLSVTIGNNLYLSSSTDSARSLGAYIDGTLSMKKMVNVCVSSCSFNLKKLKTIRYGLPVEARLLVVKSFILSKIDYCNILYCTLNAGQVRQLETVLRNAVRFIYDLKRRDSISAYMKKAHFLPVAFRIKFKTCLFVYKIINGLSPVYLNNLVTQAIPAEHNLRSNVDNLKLQQTQSGVKTIQHQMVQNWNCLPYDIRSSTSIHTFKRNLKTHYFNIAFA